MFDGEAFGGLSAHCPAAILQGGWDDWGILEEALGR